MIFYKEWKRNDHRSEHRHYYYKGWFLFGIIPLYIIRINAQDKF